jgi:16S rRNA G527 N7-methylase RsmG
VDQVGKVNCVISRGVATAEQFLDWSRPFLNPGGRIIALKGPDASSELETPTLQSLVDSEEISAEFMTFTPFNRMPGREYHAIVIKI